MTPQPQIALVGARCWAIFGPYFTTTGLLALCPFPKVECDVVDASMLDEDRLGRILHPHVGNSTGVEDVDGLIEALLQAGASLLMPCAKITCNGDFSLMEDSITQDIGGNDVVHK